jgi:micrococcal nuclease
MGRLSKKQLQAIISILMTVIIVLVSKLAIFDGYLPLVITDTGTNSVHEDNMNRVLVSRVVDGDTLKIKIGDKEDTIRLIGINTPESVDPRKVVECFGKEASLKMKELAEDKVVLIVKDPTQSERDKYGRLLAYVYLTDGTLINQKMIDYGYAFEYTYNIPYEFQTEFKESEKNAREKGLGLWNKDVCDYSKTL